MNQPGSLRATRFPARRKPPRPGGCTASRALGPGRAGVTGIHMESMETGITNINDDSNIMSTPDFAKPWFMKIRGVLPK